MRPVLRAAVLAAALAAHGLATVPSAGAAGAVHLAGTLAYDGSGWGTGWFAVTGIVNGTVTLAGEAEATFVTVQQPPATCAVTSAASGEITGALNVTFALTRLGAVAVVSTSGDVTGNGVLALAATTPTLHCGATRLYAEGSLTGL